MSTEFAFLGAAGGGLTGMSGSSRGAAAGVGAATILGRVVGSFVPEDTYIILSDVSFTQI